MTLNEQIIRAFAEQFDPPLPVAKTLRINNVPMPDAWQCAYWDAARSIGITAVAHSGGLHAFLEAAGPAEIASDAGQALAKALGLFQEKNDASPQAEGRSKGPGSEEAEGQESQS